MCYEKKNTMWYKLKAINTEMCLGASILIQFIYSCSTYLQQVVSWGLTLLRTPEIDTSHQDQTLGRGTPSRPHKVIERKTLKHTPTHTLTHLWAIKKRPTAGRGLQTHMNTPTQTLNFLPLSCRCPVKLTSSWFQKQ